MSSLTNTETFVGIFAEALSTRFTAHFKSAWSFQSVSDSTYAQNAEQLIAFRITATGELTGDCSIVLDRQQVVMLGAKILSEPVSSFDVKHADAVMQILSAGMEDFSDAMLPSFGRVRFTLDRTEATGVDKPNASLKAVDKDGEKLIIALYLREELLSSLGRAVSAKESPGGKKTNIDSSNLKLVMDVELNVSLRFGQCQLPLREVLDLTSGSVIELDRDVDDPVELLLDGRVIARGEAVIVDGNYGLRITEILEPISTHFGG